jgi:hypothetical protein
MPALVGDSIGLISHSSPAGSTGDQPEAGSLLGASAKQEVIPVFRFDDTNAEAVDFYGVLKGYAGAGGVKIVFPWGSETQIVGDVRWSAQFRAIPDDAEDLNTTAHSYSGGPVAVDTVPNVAGEVSYFEMVATHGSGMDFLADGEAFILQFTRVAGHASDTLVGDAFLLAPPPLILQN